MIRPSKHVAKHPEEHERNVTLMHAFMQRRKENQRPAAHVQDLKCFMSFFGQHKPTSQLITFKDTHDYKPHAPVVRRRSSI